MVVAGRASGVKYEWDHKVSFGVNEGPADCIMMPEVITALKKMKKHKAPHLSGLAAEIIQIQWLTDLCSGIVKEGCISEDWKSSVVLPRDGPIRH